MANKNKNKTTPGTARKADQPAERKKKRLSAAERAEAQARKNRKAKQQTYAVFGIGAAILVAVIGLAIWNALPESGSTSRNAFDLPAVANDQNGDGRFTRDDIVGKPTVVNFYASWCTTCEDEMPEFEQARVLLGDRVNFVGIHSQETDRKSRELPDRLGLDEWILAEDINGQNGGGSGYWESMPGTNPNGLPGTAFYDADGNYIDFAFRPFNRDALLAQIEALFGLTPDA